MRRWFRIIKKRLQDRMSIIIILISMGIGFGIGFTTYESIKQSAINAGTVITWIGAIVGVAGMFRAYFKDKREEIKTPKLAVGEPYRRNDGSYFLDVRLVGGQGRAQRCVGYITVEYSDIDNSATVWEHSALREYDIGTHMGLRLFKVESDSILIPAALGHQISGFVENRRQLDLFRNKRIMVEVSFVNGDKPEPYVERISNIIANAQLR